MNDMFGRMVTFLIGIVFTIFVPLTIVNLKMDDARQTIIDDAVVEFVDNARASGEITPNSYVELTKKVDSAQPMCDIDIIYESASMIPWEDDSGNITYKRALQSYTRKDIVDYMYNAVDTNGVTLTDGAGNTVYRADPVEYPLREGGYLTVKVQNTTPTPGMKMLSLFIPGAGHSTLYTVYGGYVGNNRF